MSRKDYNIHSEWAEEERKRRQAAMDRDRNQRGMFATAPWWFCEKCGGSFHGPEFMYCPCLFDWKQFDEDHKLKEITEPELTELEKDLSQDDVDIANEVIVYLKESGKSKDDEDWIFNHTFEFIMDRMKYNQKLNEMNDKLKEDYSFQKAQEVCVHTNDIFELCEDISTRIIPYVIHRVKEAPWRIKTVW